jgi:serine/threonine protein kinase
VRWAVRITVDGRRGHAFTAAATVVAGRDAECGIPLSDPRVSRAHCRFTIDPPHLSVCDLGSRNGTHVGGERVGERVLSDGDEVRLGDTTLRVAVTAAEFLGYRVGHEIGRGAQGTVFLAYAVPDGSPVALKVLHDIRPEARARFLREMQAVRALRHPNIVRFRAAGSDPAPFLVSDYCPGGSIDRLGVLPPETAVPLALGVLDGLAYAHETELPEVGLADGTTRSARGLVHRDVKPQNVLLDGGTARIADFGLAKAFELAGLSGHTHTGDVGGSAGFMPRAQILDYRRAGSAVDVWAAAATLYWLLTGSPPRDFPPGADPIAVVLREPPVPIRARVPAISRRLADTLDEALAEGRDMSARELRQALAAAVRVA